MSTSTPADDRQRVESAFGEIAQARGLVSAGQLAECQQEFRRMREEGSHVRLGEMMMAKGYLTKAQALDILKATHESLGHKRRIGGYEIEEKLGEGAMGAVYKARQISMDRTVALKLLPRSLSSNPEALGRFMREARIVANLNHPNIVRGFEFGEANGYPFFAMEYVEGGTVADRLDQEGVLSEEEVIDIGLQAGEALQHAHEHGILHRDIKPDNIMLGTEGVVKLADLGLATREGVQSITEIGDALGTPYYMSPEQAQGSEDLDGRTDLYALGASLYHLVTGRPPFDGPSAPVIMSKRLMEDPAPACSVNSHVSRSFTAVLMKMMQRDRTARYSDCAEFVTDTQRIRDGQKPQCIELARKAAVASRSATPEGESKDGSDHAGESGSAPESSALERRQSRLPQLPVWVTPMHVGVALVALSVLLIGAILGRYWDRIFGPRHPLDASIVWSKPPEAPVLKGAEAAEEWRRIRAFLNQNRNDAKAQAAEIRKFITRYPSSCHADHARDLLQDLIKRDFTRQP